MENLILVVYLIDILCNDGMRFIIFVATIILFVIALVSKIYQSEAIERGNGGLKEYWQNFGFRRYILSGFMVLTLLVGIPSKDTAYKLLAIYGGIEVINNPDVQQLGNKGYKVLNKIMDEYLKKD